jgi:hypothetical protein
MALQLSLNFNFLGELGSVQELEYNGTLTERLEELIQIEPLKKVGVDNVLSEDNFAAEGWGTWVGDPKGSLQGTQENPLGYFELKIFAKTDQKFSIESLKFSLTRDNEGPRFWQRRSNIDDFEAPIFIDVPFIEEERGVVHDEGIIELPEEAPTFPPYFENLEINGKELARTEPKWRSLAQIELHLYGFYKE